MNAAILAALEPGGTFGVIDHHAEAGSGARDADKLHRGDAEQIKAEILAAGFEWVGESAVLRHPEDDRTQGVFADGLRGKTDRFVYRFRKPETPAAR
jgi:predicted methyltransferase